MGARLGGQLRLLHRGRATGLTSMTHPLTSARGQQGPQPDRRRNPARARVDGPDAHGVRQAHRPAVADAPGVRGRADGAASGSAVSDSARDPASARAVPRSARGPRHRGLAAGARVTIALRAYGEPLGSIGTARLSRKLSTGEWIVRFDPGVGTVARILDTTTGEGTTWVRGWKSSAANALRTVVALSS